MVAVERGLVCGRPRHQFAEIRAIAKSRTMQSQAQCLVVVETLIVFLPEAVRDPRGLSCAEVSAEVASQVERDRSAALEVLCKEEPSMAHPRSPKSQTPFPIKSQSIAMTKTMEIQRPPATKQNCFRWKDNKSRNLRALKSGWNILSTFKYHHWQSQPALHSARDCDFSAGGLQTTVSTSFFDGTPTSKIYNMRPVVYMFSQALLIFGTISLVAASSWGFEDATISIHGKKAGVGAGYREKYGALTIA